MKKQLLSLVIAMSIIIGIIPVTPVSAATDASGSGWSFIAKTGELTVSTNAGTESWRNYRDKVSLNSVKILVIKDTVTRIEDYAFWGCEKITSVTIPASATYIGERSFADCYALTAVAIPDKVTTIEKYAFYKSKKIKTISIGKGVTNLHPYAFVQCDALAEINVSSDNPAYSSADGVLYNKDKTKLINYPDAKADKSFITPDTVNTIGEYAFLNQKVLTSVTLSDSVTKLERNIFDSCTKLATVKIGDGVTNLSYYMFSNSIALTTLNLGKNVENIHHITGNGTEYHTTIVNCNKLAAINVVAGNKTYSSVDGILFNSDKTEIVKYPQAKSGKTYSIPHGVAIVGKWAFLNNANLTSITIPDSVTDIMDSAFSGCDKITAFTIPDSVKTIGSYAFGDCKTLKTITMGTGVENVESSAFGGNDKLTAINVAPDNNFFSSINGILYNKDQTAILDFPLGKADKTFVIPDGVKAIGESAFLSTNIVNITIPDTVTNIGEYAFAYCHKLTSVTIPNGVTTISKGAFRECIALTSIVIPDNVITIGNEAFSWCKKAKTITIGDGVKIIGDWSFYSCLASTSIKFGNNVESIGYHAFIDSPGLTYVPDSVINVGHLGLHYTKWYDNSANGVVYAGKYLYDYKGNTATNPELVIREGTVNMNGLTGIKGLKSVIIPESMGKFSITRCDDLTSLTFKSTTPPEFGSGSEFVNCDKLTTIYVPYGAKAAYQAAPILSKYDIVEIQSPGLNICEFCSVADCTKNHSYCGFCDKYNCGVTHDIAANNDATNQVRMSFGYGTDAGYYGTHYYDSYDNTGGYSGGGYSKHSTVEYLFKYNDGTFWTLSDDGRLKHFKADGITLIQEKKIDIELAFMGAAFMGEKYNFIAFGQPVGGSLADLKSGYRSGREETIRIVKYDKNWNRLDSARETLVTAWKWNQLDIQGNDLGFGNADSTPYPFGASGARFAENKDLLLLSLGREMYDGHQSNLNLFLNTDTMTWQEQYNSEGYVSHSFNSFPLFDGDSPVILNHGDALPVRGLILQKADARVVMNTKFNISSYKFNKSSTLLKMPGKNGDNETGVTVGGLEMSANNYLSIYTSLDHSTVKTYGHWLEFKDGYVDQRDIFVSVLPRGFKNNANPTNKTVATYIGTDKVCSNPKIIKKSDDLFAVVWEEFRLVKEDGRGFRDNSLGIVIQYINGNGDKVGEQIKTFKDNIWVDLLNSDGIIGERTQHVNTCAVCGKSNCGISHVYCNTCKKYDCKVNHNSNEYCAICDNDPCICDTIHRCNIPGCPECLPFSDCADCELFCRNCNGCRECRSDASVATPNAVNHDSCGECKACDCYILGAVIDAKTITISDALQVLMCLAKMDSSVLRGGKRTKQNLRAALIVKPEANEPTIQDVLHILMALANMDSSDVDGTIDGRRRDNTYTR